MFKHNLKAVLNMQRPDKKGQYPLRIRTTIKRKITYYSTGIMLTKAQWNGSEIIKHPNRQELNVVLQIKKIEVEKSLLQSVISGNDVPKIKKYLNLTFYNYADKKIKEWTGAQAPATILHKSSYLRKFNEFKPGIKLSEVNKDTLREYEDFCRGRGNVDNTTWGCTKFVKTILNAAIEDGILTGKPHKGFKGAKYVNPMRLSLSEHEVELFEGYADDEQKDKRLRDVAAWFVFSCYTGLRYGDLNCFKGFTNDKVLLQTEKTGEIVSIFATKKIIKAKERLTRAAISNQKMNDYLKIIAIDLKINKKVTCHLARHTFAVSFLTKGGRLEILQKLLGHNSIATTGIYGKISNKMADDEMKRVWA